MTEIGYSRANTRGINAQVKNVTAISLAGGEWLPQKPRGSRRPYTISTTLVRNRDQSCRTRTRGDASIPSQADAGRGEHVSPLAARPIMCSPNWRSQNLSRFVDPRRSRLLLLGSFSVSWLRATPTLIVLTNRRATGVASSAFSYSTPSLGYSTPSLVQPWVLVAGFSF